MNSTLAVAAALIVILSIIPYVRDIFKGKSKPNAVSWFTWTLLISIGGFAALSADETNTAIITFGDAIAVGMVFLLGLKYGFAKFSLFDGLCQVGAVIGLVLWAIFDSPTTAIVATVSIDLIASLPTIRHSWLKPGEETWQTYGVSAVGGAIGLFSIKEYAVASLAYPVYLVFIGSLLATVIILSRRNKNISLTR